MCATALRSQKSVKASFVSFFMDAMVGVLTISGRINFLQLARYCKSCEQRFRQNFRKTFDWIAFNQFFVDKHPGHRYAIAIDPSFVSKSGKHTPGISYFWSGCAQAMKRGLEILGIALVDADTREAVAIRAVQTIVHQLRRGRKSDCVKQSEKDSLMRKVFFSTDCSISAKEVIDIYRSRFQIEFLFRDAKQFTGLCHCQARDTRALDFAFNLSLAAINIAKAFCRHYNLNFSIADLKLLMHNAMMIERFLSMFGNLPNVHKNQGLKEHYFKDLLLYGLKASA